MTINSLLHHGEGLSSAIWTPARPQPQEVHIRDFILFMHDEALTPPSSDAWARYFCNLRDLKSFDGGSAIGAGAVFRKHAPAGRMSNHLGGYIRVRAIDFAAAQALLSGNPVFEGGGTVEIRELPNS